MRKSFWQNAPQSQFSTISVVRAFIGNDPVTKAERSLPKRMPCQVQYRSWHLRFSRFAHWHIKCSNVKDSRWHRRTASRRDALLPFVYPITIHPWATKVNLKGYALTTYSKILIIDIYSRGQSFCGLHPPCSGLCKAIMQADGFMAKLVGSNVGKYHTKFVESKFSLSSICFTNDNSI